MDGTPNSTAKSALLEFKTGIGWLTDKTPHFAEKFNAFTEECFKEGALTQREKQLIALGISLHTQNEYCLAYHTKGCLDHDCSEEEILEVIGVAAAFAGGTAVSQGITTVQNYIRELRQ